MFFTFLEPLSVIETLYESLLLAGCFSILMLISPYLSNTLQLSLIDFGFVST